MDLRWLSQMGLTMVFALALSACGSDAEEANTDGSQATAAPLFMLSADGVGPLNAETPFNLVRIGDAFQNFNVAQETHYRGGGQYPVITIKQQSKPLLSINPDYREEGIFSVVVHDNLIGNKLGHAIGTPFRDVYAAGKTERCVAGADEWRGKVMCFAPKTQNVLYIFSGQWNGAGDQLPPMKEMADWRLDTMVWKAIPNKKG